MTLADAVATAVPVAGRACPSCGNGVSEAAVICVSCGTKLATGEKPDITIPVDEPTEPAGPTQRFTGMLAAVRPKPQKSEGRQFDAADEHELRKRNLLALGVVLVVSFFLPTCAPVGMNRFLLWPNIEVLQLPGVVLPPLAVALVLFPLIGGLAAIAAAFLLKPPLRSAAFIALGVLPVLMLLISSDTRALLQQGGSGAMQTSTGKATLMSLLGAYGILIGARARWYRPGSPWACYVGMAGGVIYLIYLVMPVMPAHLGRIPLLTPFSVMKMNGLVGFGMLIGTLLTLGAAAASAGNLLKFPVETATTLSNLAFRMLVGGTVIAWAMLVFAMLGQMPGELFFFVASMFVKLAVMIGAIVMLLPSGVSDAIVAQPAPAVSKEGHRLCKACGYDLTGSNLLKCPECGAARGR